ncbi:MAG TPA: TolC family protein, partial [Burkholderiales bacterium]
MAAYRLANRKRGGGTPIRRFVTTPMQTRTFHDRPLRMRAACNGARTVAVAAALSAAILAASARAEPLTFTQVLQRAVDNDAALRIARLELERARLEAVRVESTLGWFASGQTGFAHDLNLFGIPSDRLSASGSIERRLESGASLGFGLGVAHEDSAIAVVPMLPNPMQSLNVDARYRVPLAQGANNVEYRQGLESAEASVEAALAEWDAARDALARQAADLYFSAALTHARLQNASAAIERAERLRAFVLRNIRLGVLEEKDRLQAEAQLRARRTEQRALQALWDSQRIALNRLMERDWDSAFEPRVEAPPPIEAAFDLAALEAQALEHSPDLRREQARLRLANAAIERVRDAIRDRLDLVFSLGGRHVRGDTAAFGSVSETEGVAGVQLEYRAALDRRGAEAELAQAYLARDVARRRYDTFRTNLRYDVARTVAEIEAFAAALAQARATRDAEQRKLEEATERYRTGRADTAELIQFENDYEAAALAVARQAIELARRRVELARLSG